MTEAERITQNVILTGRACVRIVEAADVLLDHRPVWTERLLLRLVRALYSHRLRGLVTVLPAGNLKEQALGAGVVYCQACGVKMSVQKHEVKYRGRRYSYLYYRCPYDQANMSLPGCVKHAVVSEADANLWGKVWELISEQGKFEAAIQNRVAELRAQEFDAMAECEKLQKQLDDLPMKRQELIAWAQEKIITKADLELRLTSLTFEQAEAERLMEVARIYRERVMAGVKVNFDPQTPEEKQALFDWRRKVVQGLVERANMAADKSIKVQVELDLENVLPEKSVPVDLCVRNTSARRVL